MTAPAVPRFPTDNLPAELRALPQWVAWRYEEREGERTKVPVNPHTGNRAKVTDAATWTDFTTAAAFASTRADIAGIGFVLTADDPYLVIDLDGCRDAETGALSAEAREAVERFATYTEVSPSGTGLHLWLRGEPPGTRNRTGKIEIYHRDRYMSVTGQRHAGTPAEIAARPTELADFYTRVFAPKRPMAEVANDKSATFSDFPRAKETESNAVAALSDADLLTRIRRSKSKDKFHRLWAGDGTGYGSPSEADFALCGLLAFWTGGDTARMDRLFQQSGLMRPKWDERRGGQTYGETTITKAAADTREYYTPRSKVTPIRSGAQDNKSPGRPERAHGEQLNDVANGHRFAGQHGDDLCYCHPLKTWFFWDGRRWRRDATGEVVRRAKQVAANIYREAAEAPEAIREDVAKWAQRSHAKERLDAMIVLAQSEPGIFVEAGNLDADPWLLTCLNGTIDLRTGTLQPHRRDDLITRLCPVFYDANATLPLWDTVLDKITGGDTTYRGFLQRAAGYSLTGNTGEEVLFFAHGPAATGKSTFLEALKATLGEYATTADFEAFLSRSSVGAPRNDIARLAGARLVVSIEVDEGKKLAEGLVKMLTGGDTVTARFLYQEAFEFKPAFKLWLAANHAPHVRDDDEAMWRRILRLPFTQVVPKAERKKEVKASLCDPAVAGPAILAWMVQGCLAWQHEGLGVPQAVDEATAQYRLEMDPLTDFIADCCVLDKDVRVPVADLWKAYQDYSRANGEDWPLARKEFAERLERRGCVPGKSGNVRLWKGIGLLTNQSAPMEKDLGVPPIRDYNTGHEGHEGHEGHDFCKVPASSDSRREVSQNHVPRVPRVPEASLALDADPLTIVKHRQLTDYCRAVVERGDEAERLPDHLVWDTDTVGFPAEKDERALAYARRWFGLAEGNNEGGKRV